MQFSLISVRSPITEWLILDPALQLRWQLQSLQEVKSTERGQVGFRRPDSACHSDQALPITPHQVCKYVSKALAKVQITRNNQPCKTVVHDGESQQIMPRI